MNKKGFTLIELLAVIAIIALISIIAIPNVINLVDATKKDTMLGDAKKLISLAKYEVNVNYDIRNFTNTTLCASNICTLGFNMLNKNGDLEKDPDDELYSTYASSSYVKYEKNGNTVKYCVRLVGSKLQVGTGTDGCVYEDNLYSRSNVIAKVS